MTAHKNPEHGADITIGLNTDFISKRMQHLRLTAADVGELVADLLNRKAGAFSPWTVQTWLSGKGMPDGMTLCALAQLLELEGGQVFAHRLSPKEQHAAELQNKLAELDTARKQLLLELEASR
jgi:hypothetical protein